MSARPVKGAPYPRSKKSSWKKKKTYDLSGVKAGDEVFVCYVPDRYDGGGPSPMRQKVQRKLAEGFVVNGFFYNSKGNNISKYKYGRRFLAPLSDPELRVIWAAKELNYMVSDRMHERLEYPRVGDPLTEKGKKDIDKALKFYKGLGPAKRRKGDLKSSYSKERKARRAHVLRILTSACKKTSPK